MTDPHRLDPRRTAAPDPEPRSAAPRRARPRRLAELLRSRPHGTLWERICALLEECDAAELAAVTPAVLRWPAAQRPMPDHWWAQWTRGDVRPYHALAGTRWLGRLDSAETGTVDVPVEEDWPGCHEPGAGPCPADEPAAAGPDPAPAAARGGAEADAAGEGGEAGPASLDHGAAAVGAPASLRWLALGARAPWQDRGGDVVRWETTRDAPLVWYLHGAGSRDEACDLQVSPDGGTVVTAVQGDWLAWSAATGAPLWRLGPQLTGSAAGGRGSTSLDDPVRFGFSADGERVAAGTCGSDVVAVVETRTGEVLLSVPPGQDAFGPVALDAGGTLLAHAAPGGRVVIREVPFGEVLATAETGLSTVGALALAPDGHAVFAVGGTVGGSAEDAGLSVLARPAARVLTLRLTGPDAPRLEPGELIRPAGCPAGIDADSQLAAVSARACWVGEVPYAFLGADFGSVLFDGAGHTRWADPAGAIACFTPDGRALVVVQDDISVWFLDGMGPPGPPPEGPPAAPGEVLFTGLPLPGAPPDGPCSHWPVRLAATADDARAVVFSTQPDRSAARRRQVVCRRPDGGGPVRAALLAPGPASAAALSALAVSPCGRLAARAVLAEHDWLLVDDVATAAPLWRYELPPGGHLGPRRLRLAFSGDGRRIAVAAADGRSVVLAAATGEVVAEFVEPGPLLQAVALDATGTLVAHGMGDGRGRLVVRRVADGAALLEAGPKSMRQLIGLGFAPDGGELVAAGATYGRDAAIWTVPLGGGDLAPVPRIAVHDLPMGDQAHGCLAWSAAGPRVCFPGNRGASVVWDAVTGRVLADIPFGAGEGAPALSPDGRTLVTVTQSGARRWTL